jgi:hypothetical protein
MRRQRRTPAQLVERRRESALCKQWRIDAVGRSGRCYTEGERAWSARTPKRSNVVHLEVT